MRRVYRRKRPFQYLFPFLIFLGIGIIAVLGFQLWQNLQGAKGDVYFYIASGNAKMLEDGATEWDNVYSGTKMLLGDSVKTLDNSRGVLQFFNGTIVRLDANTQVTITDITKRSDVEKIGLTLTSGNIWVNKTTTEGVSQSDITVRTTHLLVDDTGSIFEVETGSTEIVRVNKGGVQVQILDNTNKDALLDTAQVGVGQELDLNQAILQSLQNHESPSLLLAMNPQFQQSDWYNWNMQQDANPTDFSQANQYAPITASQQSSQQNFVLPPATQQSLTPPSPTPSTTPQATVPSSTTTQTLQAPVITQPASTPVTTNQSKMNITGTVGPGTAKVVVQETIAGVSDTYTLSKFKAGDTSFTYNVSTGYGNYKQGDNTYQFIAIDASGNQSTPTEVDVTYNPAGSSTSTQQTTTTTTPTTVSGTLTAPQVVSYNDTNSSTVTVSVVKVIGSVSGAASVFVNGYKLSKFQPGDTSWTYYANVAGGNLQPGVNNYQAYSVDANGNQSSITNFTITYNPTAGTTSSTQQTTTASTSTSTQATTSPSGATSGSTTSSNVSGDTKGF